MARTDEVRVHGRDFRGYRIGGAIVALLFLIALVWQAVYIFQGYNVVTPRVGWAATGGAQGTVTAGNLDTGAPSGEMASQVLTQRTSLLRDRAVSGPAPGQPAPPLAVGGQERLVEAPLNSDAATYSRAWSQPDSDTLGMLRGGQNVSGFTAVPYANAGVFERPEGRAWRHGIADYTVHLGALAIIGAIVLLGLVLALRGRVPIAEGRDGRMVKRFGFIERATHWMTSGSFVMLALTGIVIAFGKTLIGPVFGAKALGDVGWISTWAHMIFVPSFFIGIVLLAVMWILRNLPEPSLDIPWLVRLGGFMSDSPDNPPARKFNAGQKITFWVTLLGGLVMTGTGVTLMFPYFWAGISTLVWVMLAHAIIGLLMTAFFIGHAYIGTVGMQGAIHAMWGGRVDLNWAREHHELWLDELARKGELPPDMRGPDAHEPYRPVTPPPGRAVAAGRGQEV